MSPRMKVIDSSFQCCIRDGSRPTTYAVQTEYVNHLKVLQISDDTVSTGTTELDASNVNTVAEGSIMPYKEVDSLIAIIEQRYKVADL
jgi:hypothetical protein